MTTSLRNSDADARLRALDPKKSFIVQAPAGSGKTELLTQRFLVLLSSVNSPEEILAITFTKKSAAEMRSRIMRALLAAKHNPQPQAAHEKMTWQLAKNALQQNEKLRWYLLENPNQLRIQTIDSFNASLSKHLPILSQFGSMPEIIDDARPLYRKAVHEFLTHLEENLAWSKSIAELLQHLDNHLENVADLLMDMLAKRDQWLPYLASNSNEADFRGTLEQQLRAINLDILSHLDELFPREQREEVLTLFNYAINNRPEDTQLQRLERFPEASLENKSQWIALARFLLTSSCEWRKKLDKNNGFPAASSEKNLEKKALNEAMKNRMQHLLEILIEHDDLKFAFTELLQAPDVHYSENQWRVLRALHQTLKVVVAQLKLVFQQEGKIDYVENTQAALLALGSQHLPTDLTLALDYQLKHILIDEFQDTSNTQSRLLEKLTAGWQNGDSRTLFLVGDPMQSIYRFREAEVGLFIRARKKGIHGIALEPLTLTVNFRSTEKIVSWVNQYFQNIFPAFDDIANGAVSFSQSIAHSTQDGFSEVNVQGYLDQSDDTQAQAILDKILLLRNNFPDDTIAVLARSRQHLKNIIAAFKKANVAYQAIDIDPLWKRPAIQDVMALTRALLHPADRIAWLAVLRAPWCGLLLKDLLLIAGENAYAPIFERLQNETVVTLLSEDAQRRLSRILPVLRIKMAERCRYGLRGWIESTWKLLGGPATLENPADLADMDAYFNLLAELDHGGSLLDFDHLQEKIERLFAAPQHETHARVHIMTIHTAKGLEFDHVFVPHLEKKSPYDAKQLLAWMEIPREQKDTAFILAPIHAAGEKENVIYDYIKQHQTLKNDFEIARLLYVAATRAKKSLHMYFNLKSSESDKKPKPVANSLLNACWDAIKNDVLLNKTTTLASGEQSTQVKSIRRLSADWINPVHESNPLEGIYLHQKISGFLLENNHPKIIGTVLHRILQYLAQMGVSQWPKAGTDQFLHQQLIQEGMTQEALPAAITVLKQAIEKTLTDPRGQWILSAHSIAQSEYPLTAYINGEVQSFILDRTFVDEQNIRWIIDYKTSVNEGDLEEFLKHEEKTYREKMLQYKLAMQAMDSREIRLGLYFPMISAWREL